jgi:hypothetical protein
MLCPVVTRSPCWGANHKRLLYSYGGLLYMETGLGEITLAFTVPRVRFALQSDALFVLSSALLKLFFTVF